jgi:hypothetical protein
MGRAKRLVREHLYLLPGVQKRVESVVGPHQVVGPEWRYVNVRRLFIYHEHPIDQATQWAVFEPNNDGCGAPPER